MHHYREYLVVQERDLETKKAKRKQGCLIVIVCGLYYLSDFRPKDLGIGQRNYLCAYGPKEIIEKRVNAGPWVLAHFDLEQLAQRREKRTLIESEKMIPAWTTTEQVNEPGVMTDHGGEDQNPGVVVVTPME